MIICSCTTISDYDIELALLEIMIEDDAPIPTPGIVWRHMQQKMNCCGCAPFAVDVIYEKLLKLQEKGLISPSACQNALDRRQRALEREETKATADKA
ncbi:MAG: hypothetical protein RIC14_14355 [Filomicrobium sp.]